MDTSYKNIIPSNSQINVCNFSTDIEQRKAITALAVGIIITLASFFLLLAAFQIFPHSLNAISLWKPDSIIIGALASSIGIMVTGYGIYCSYNPLSGNELEITNTHEAIEHENDNLSSVESNLKQVVPEKNEKLERPAQTKSIIHKSVPAQESHIPILSNNLNMESLGLVGAGKHRLVYKISDTDLIIKSAKGFIPLSLTHYECIMYEMSELLNFGVVPYTQYIVPESEEAQLINARCPRLKQPIILQRFITQKRHHTLNIEQAHKTIFFTWITGRIDTKRENSIVDKEGKVWEVDNELGGSKLMNRLGGKKGESFYHESHWLLEKSEINVPIEYSLLDWILNLPDHIELNKTSLPNQFKASTVCSVETLFSTNLKLLKTAIRNLQKKCESITFELLKLEIDCFRKKSFSITSSFLG